MVRIMVNEAAYTAKRNVIRDVGQRAVETTGYEQVAIADLLSELHISSGSLYHYFDSRSVLLERMVDQAEQLVLPIVHDPKLSALDKRQRFFATLDHENAVAGSALLGRAIQLRANNLLLNS